MKSIFPTSNFVFHSFNLHYFVIFAKKLSVKSLWNSISWFERSNDNKGYRESKKMFLCPTPDVRRLLRRRTIFILSDTNFNKAESVDHTMQFYITVAVAVAVPRHSCSSTSNKCRPETKGSIGEYAYEGRYQSRSAFTTLMPFSMAQPSFLFKTWPLISICPSVRLSAVRPSVHAS